MLYDSDLSSSFCFSSDSVKPHAEACFVNFVSFVLSGASAARPIAFAPHPTAAEASFFVSFVPPPLGISSECAHG